MGSKRSAPNISKPTRMAGDSLGSTDRNRESHIRSIRRTEGATTSRERREAFDKKVENLSPERRKEFEENRSRGVVKQINKPRPPRENEFREPKVVRPKPSKDSNFSNMIERRREKNIARSDI